MKMNDCWKTTLLLNLKGNKISSMALGLQGLSSAQAVWSNPLKFSRVLMFTAKEAQIRLHEEELGPSLRLE